MFVWVYVSCLKVNSGKNKVMVLNGEEALEWEFYLEKIRLEHVSEFEHLGCLLDESGTDGNECSREVVNGRRVAGAMRFLVNAMDLQAVWANLVWNFACTYSYVWQWDKVLEGEGEV